MTDKQIVVFLVDADNLAEDSIRDSFARLVRRQGAVHVRRAYCSPEKAMQMTKLFRELAIRPMVNEPSGKNSTDIALTADAMELALGHQPSVIAIASSDRDFAPLTLRLKERGVLLLGFGERHKTSAETGRCYDHFEFVGEALTTPVPVAKPVLATQEKVESRTVSQAVPAPNVSEKDHEVLQKLLSALHDWKPGQSMQLNALGKTLTDAKLKLSKPLYKHFERHPAYFAVAPKIGPAKSIKLIKR